MGWEVLGVTSQISVDSRTTKLPLSSVPINPQSIFLLIKVNPGENVAAFNKLYGCIMYEPLGGVHQQLLEHILLLVHFGTFEYIKQFWSTFKSALQYGASNGN